MIFDQAIALMPKVREDLLRIIPFELQKQVGLNMNLSANGDKSKNTTTTLNVRKGNLFRSFTPNNPMNIFNKTANGIEYGSKIDYAAIHEFGGTIKHPGSNKRQAWMGASGLVVAHGTKAHDIPMPKRSYLAPAIRTLEEEKLEQLIFQVLMPIRELFA